MKYKIISLGCKVNAYESEALTLHPRVNIEKFIKSPMC